MKKEWYDSEVQGKGRRYWFNSKAKMNRFLKAKQKQGYAPTGLDRFGAHHTCWCPFAKGKTKQSKLVRAGVDTLALDAF